MARLEKARGIGAWRTIVIEIPFGMSSEAARAALGIDSGAAALILFVNRFGDPAGLPRVISGNELAGDEGALGLES